MTNQLTYTDLDTPTTTSTSTGSSIGIGYVPPAKTTPSTSDEQPESPQNGRGRKLTAGGVALALAAVVGFAVVGTDSTDTVEPSVEQRPAYLIIQDEMPTVSNLNYGAGVTRPNLATVPVSASGKVCLFTLATTHLVADVTGFLSSESTEVVDLTLTD